LVKFCAIFVVVGYFCYPVCSLTTEIVVCDSEYT